MAESVEDRLDAVEAELISLNGETRMRDIGEVLELIHGILADITKDMASASEFTSDLERIDLLVRLLR